MKYRADLFLCFTMSISYLFSGCQKQLNIVAIPSIPVTTQPASIVPPVQTPVTSLIQSINYEEYDNLRDVELQTLVSGTSLSGKFYSRYQNSYSYDDRGDLKSQIKTNNTQNSISAEYLYSHESNKIIKAYKFDKLSFLDTTFLETGGRPVEIHEHWDNSFKRRFLYEYNDKEQLITEHHYSATGCGFMHQQFGVNHSFSDGNRVLTKTYFRMGWTTEPVDQKSAQSVYTYTYEYDLTKPNPGLPYDNFKIATACTGILDPVNHDPNQLHNRSKNLLKHMTVRLDGYAIVYRYYYDYLYDFDTKGRVKTLTLIKSGSGGQGFLRRTYQYVD